MNFRILLKSIKFAFRAKKRVFFFIIVYAVLIIWVAKSQAIPALGIPSWIMALIVSTVYAILIAQFRRRDIAILKCLSWRNSEILLLLVGEVVLVSLSAFLLIFQVSVEILGLVAYFEVIGPNTLLAIIQDLITVPAVDLGMTMLVIVVFQIPGLLLAQYRAMNIPPMRALREE